MTTKIKINIFRRGYDLYAAGLPGYPRALKLVPTLTPEDLLVEAGGRAYLKAYLQDGKIFADILRVRDNGNICHYTFTGHEGVVEFDPWDRV